jgi:hypothetical protein
MLHGTYDVLIVKDFSRFSRRNSRGLVELEDLRGAWICAVPYGYVMTKKQIYYI